MITAGELEAPTTAPVEGKLSAATGFDPERYFDAWLAAVNEFRERQRAQPSAGVLINGNDLDFEAFITFDDKLAETLASPGTLVVAEHGVLKGNVEVTVAMIDGVFKGNITASESVVVENHAVVIGDINTPTLTIRGGAIIEGTCNFAGPKERENPPVWSVLKGSLSKVWRGRLFQ